MEQQISIAGKMTSLAIAEITGKKHYNVMKAIRSMEDAWVKLGQVKFYLSSYINKQNRAMPMYELSKTECLYIATKFNDEARAKLVIRWEELESERKKPMDTLDMVQASIDAIRENQKELAEVKQNILELQAKTTTRPRYFTVAGYGKLNGLSINIKLAAKVGRKASRLCKEQNLMIDKCEDPRFGEVNMYPAEVLEKVFEQEIN